MAAWTVQEVEDIQLELVKEGAEPAKLIEVLQKLQARSMSAELIKKTGIKKSVKTLHEYKPDPEVQAEALQVTKGWKCWAHWRKQSKKMDDHLKLGREERAAQEQLLLQHGQRGSVAYVEDMKKIRRKLDKKGAEPWELVEVLQELQEREMSPYGIRTSKITTSVTALCNSSNEQARFLKCSLSTVATFPVANNLHQVKSAATLSAGLFKNHLKKSEKAKLETRKSVDRADQLVAELRTKMVSDADKRKILGVTNIFVQRNNGQQSVQQTMNTRANGEVDSQLLDKIRATYDASDLIMKLHTFEISVDTLSRLGPEGWFSMDIIEWWNCLTCVQYGGESIDFEMQEWGKLKFHIVSTYFYSRLTQGGNYDYKNVKRWLKKLELAELDLVIVPIFIDKNHWEKEISTFDPKNQDHKEILANLLRYVGDESTTQDVAFNSGSWKTRKHHIGEHRHRQHNNWDCGLFTILFCHHIASGTTFDYDQAEFPRVRRWMVQTMYEEGVANGQVVPSQLFVFSISLYWAKRELRSN